MREYSLEQIQPLEELEALRKKAGSPCDKHDGGECDCGKTTAAIIAPPEEVAADSGTEGEGPTLQDEGLANETLKLAGDKTADSLSGAGLRRKKKKKKRRPAEQ